MDSGAWTWVHPMHDPTIHYERNASIMKEMEYMESDDGQKFE